MAIPISMRRRIAIPFVCGIHTFQYDPYTGFRQIVAAGCVRRITVPGHGAAATFSRAIGRLVVDKLAERFTMGQPPAYGR